MISLILAATITVTTPPEQTLIINNPPPPRDSREVACFILQVDPCKEAMKGKMSPIGEKPNEETK